MLMNMFVHVIVGSIATILFCVAVTGITLLATFLIETYKGR